MTLSITTETLKWLSSLPILMQESFWWWQCSDRYIISLFPHLHAPFPPFSPSLISPMVSVDVKHHVFLLTLLLLFVTDTDYGTQHSSTHYCVFETFSPRLVTQQDEIQTQKGSNERLFILTRTHDMQILWGNPLYQCQQSSKHRTNCKNSTKTRQIFFFHFSSFLTVYPLFKCCFVAW